MYGLKTARMKKQLTQKQVAEMAGITQAYYSELESGKKKNPTITLLFKFAEALEISVDDLFSAEEKRERKGAENHE